MRHARCGAPLTRACRQQTGLGDQEAHEVTGDIKNFRDGLFGIPPESGVPADPLFLFNPLTGSLYDERFYKQID